MSGSNYSPLMQRTSPRNSNDSDDSLRALELTEGPAFMSPRARSYSASGFQFESLPLTTSLSQPIGLAGGDISERKGIGLVKGIALCVGLQVSSVICYSMDIC